MYFNTALIKVGPALGGIVAAGGLSIGLSQAPLAFALGSYFFAAVLVVLFLVFSGFIFFPYLHFDPPQKSSDNSMYQVAIFYEATVATRARELQCSKSSSSKSKVD